LFTDIIAMLSDDFQLMVAAIVRHDGYIKQFDLKANDCP
jgi:hypothetical protein